MVMQSSQARKKMKMEWTEEDRGDYSVFHSGDWTLEPEDLDFDQWSLYLSDTLMFEGGFDACKEHAKTRD